jgi:hypothetical protein
LVSHSGNTSNPHNVSISGTTDANISSPTDGQVLTWDVPTARWINDDIGGGNGNDYVTSGSFNTTSGVITLNRLSGGTVDYGINGKYLDLSGGTMSNQTLVSNLNADLLGDSHSSFYSLTGHTHDDIYPVIDSFDAHTGDTSNPHSVTKAQVGLTNVVDVEQATLAEYDIHTGDTSNPHSVTATQVGLGSVDDTSDADKPVSTAQQTALDLKANESALVSHSGNTSNPHSVTKAQVGLTNVVDVEQATVAEYDIHTGDTSNPHSVTQTQVGLSNVDNTTDANKPVSTAQQTALDLKANESALVSHSGNTGNPHSVTKAQVGLTNVVDIAQASQADFVTHSGTTTGNPHGVTASDLTLGNVDNTSDADKPVSTATQTALDLKANEAALVTHSGDTSNPHSTALSGLTDTTIGSPTDNQALAWDVATGKWIPQTISGGGGGNDYVVSGSFNTGSGVVTLNTLTGDTVTYGINGKYLDLTGGTMSNQTLVTNLNADLLGDSHSSFYSLTGHTHTGIVTKVSTPVNDQVGVWTGDGTIEGDANLTFSSSQLNIGVNDTSTGILVLYGNATTTGGQFYMYNSAGGDTDDNYYLTEASSGTLKIKGNATGDFLTYYSVNQQLAFSGAVISDQTTPQILTTGNSALITKEYGDQYYASSGATYALSGLTDTTFAITPVDGDSLTWNASASSWSATTSGGGGGDVTKVGTPLNNQVGVWTGDGTIEGTNDFKFDSATGILSVGTADTNRGIFHAFGNSASLGGILRLYNGATVDTENDFFMLQADSSGDFRIEAGTTGVFFQYNSGNQDITIADYGSGTVTGTATYMLGVTSAGKIIEEALPSVSGLTDTTFAITPVDGDALVWNNDAGTWSATTISGETGPQGPAGEVTSGGTFTLSNKRIQPRVVSATTYTTDTGTSLDVETCDLFVVTALDGALLFNNPSGTPSDGEKIMIRIKDDGTARALTYGSEFRAMGTTLPTTTVISKTLYMGIAYNGLDGKWDLIASAQEA